MTRTASGYVSLKNQIVFQEEQNLQMYSRRRIDTLKISRGNQSSRYLETVGKGIETYYRFYKNQIPAKKYPYLQENSQQFNGM